MVNHHRPCERMYYFHLQRQWVQEESLFAVLFLDCVSPNVEVLCSFEMPLTIYQRTLRNIREELNLKHRCKNLKYCISFNICTYMFFWQLRSRKFYMRVVSVLLLQMWWVQVCKGVEVTLQRFVVWKSRPESSAGSVFFQAFCGFPRPFQANSRVAPLWDLDPLFSVSLPTRWTSLGTRSGPPSRVNRSLSAAMPQAFPSPDVSAEKHVASKRVAADAYVKQAVTSWEQTRISSTPAYNSRCHGGRKAWISAITTLGPDQRYQLPMCLAKISHNRPFENVLYLF